MKIKEIQQGTIEIKQKNIGGIIASGIFLIAGLIMLIANIINTNLVEHGIIIGIVLLAIGAILLFTWKSKKTTFNKNQNTMIYAEQRINKKRELRIPLNEIKDVTYRESINRTRDNDGRAQTNATRTVEITRTNGEIFEIYSRSSKYNPFLNRTKTGAQNLADFLGVPLQAISLEDAVKGVFNKFTGQNQN